MTTEQKNRMIAEFMQIEVKQAEKALYWVYLRKTDEDGNKCYGLISEMQYHTSWNWLMPVVEKIRSFTGRSSKYAKLWKEIRIGLLNVNISAVYEAVIKFIEYHNHLNQQP